MNRLAVVPELFQGAVSFETGAGWLKPWRLPFARIDLFPSPGDALKSTAERAAGVRLRFRTASTTVGLEVVPDTMDRRFDLTRDGALSASLTLPAGAETVVFDGLAGEPKTLELWLPQVAPVKVKALQLDDGARAELVPDLRPRWITYGSSITHCGEAHSPSRTWPACVARAAGLDLTCLGFGGQCHIDPMLALTIRDLPADFISLKLGINVQGGSSLSPRTFKAAVIGMVRIIRERHATVPIAVISPIISPPREDKPNTVGLSLQQMRIEVADAVRRLQGAGDEQLLYVDGLDLFGAGLVQSYLPDQLHPNGDGYERLAANFLRVVLGKMDVKREEGNVRRKT